MIKHYGTPKVTCSTFFSYANFSSYFVFTKYYFDITKLLFRRNEIVFRKNEIIIS